MMDPKLLKDEELKPFYCEYMRRYMKEYNKKNPERSKKAMENYWRKKLGVADSYEKNNEKGLPGKSPSIFNSILEYSRNFNKIPKSELSRVSWYEKVDLCVDLPHDEQLLFTHLLDEKIPYFYFDYNEAGLSRDEAIKRITEELKLKNYRRFL